MSGTCSVRTENAGTTMSVSTSKASRADTSVSGRSIAEVGRISARVATLFIGWAVPVSSVKSLTPAQPRAKSGQLPRGRHAGRRHQARAERGISQVDYLQSFLGRAVAAIGVRMVALGQLLVARLHRVQRGRPGQAEGGKRLAQLRRGLLRRPGGAALHPTGGEQMQRIA